MGVGRDREVRDIVPVCRLEGAELPGLIQKEGAAAGDGDVQGVEVDAQVASSGEVEIDGPRRRINLPPADPNQRPLTEVFVTHRGAAYLVVDQHPAVRGLPQIEKALVVGELGNLGDRGARVAGVGPAVSGEEGAVLILQIDGKLIDAPVRQDEEAPPDIVRRFDPAGYHLVQPEEDLGFRG